MKNIAIIGGSGLVGQHLSQKLAAKGFKVCHYGRSKRQDSPYQTYTFNYKQNNLEEEGIRQVDVVINLAGANVGSKRWTKKRKQEIFDSRVRLTDFFHQKIQNINPQIEAYISASAIGFYGMQTTEKIFTEKDKAGTDFLAKVCHAWEESAGRFSQDGIRTVKLRIGLVLAKNGGALSKMKAAAKLGILSPLGNGKQYLPWIHIDDLCELFILAIENKEMNGAYNAVAPEHITNKEFTKALLKQYNRKMWLPNVPGFILKLILGDQANLLLRGSRISCKKITSIANKFEYRNIYTSLKNIL